MLALSRKPGERIIIRTPGGKEILVEVAYIRHGKVMLRFGADRDVNIAREEVDNQAQAAAPKE